MATIRKLPSGKWNVQVRRKGIAPISKTFRTKAAAEAWVRDTEHRADRGELVDLAEAARWTIDDLLLRYEREITPRKRSAIKERSRLRVLRAGLGQISLGALKPDSIVAFADRRLRSVTSDTVRKELGTLAHAVDVAIKLWDIHLPANPVTTARHVLTSTRTLRAGVSRDRRLRKGEFRRLLKVSRPEHRALWVWLVESAMRRGEVSAMKPEHRAGNLLRIPETKTDKPRIIPVTRHMARVWATLPLGIRPDSITQAFERCCKKAAIVDLHLHDLRHEATSRLFEKGLDLHEVAIITGHSDWKSLKRYTHPDPQRLADKLAGRG